MTAASVLGVPITPARASACRELLAGVASRAAWLELGALVSAAQAIDRQPVRGPEGEGASLLKTPLALHVLARCALGSACARCGAPIEDGGEELADGWCCSACAARQHQQEAFRRRAAMWLRRGNQQGLFGVEPARARRRRR